MRLSIAVRIACITNTVCLMWDSHNPVPLFVFFPEAGIPRLPRPRTLPVMVAGYPIRIKVEVPKPPA